MPNLTVQEARQAVIDAAFALDQTGDIPTVSLAMDALLAAHDAEGVTGRWVALPPDEGDPDWWVCAPDIYRGISCPDEATAIAYRDALNRADHSLKEGT